nr:transglycosylase SLT domain-containing protein [Desulfonema ishimotonii]
MAFGFAGCAGGPPEQGDNLCAVFRERPEWYDDARESSRKWGVPIPVLMAIIYRESGFRSDARPSRTRCLFIFPGPRPSSAYGYPQALDTTWDSYRKQTGNRGADRNDFDDATDFVGWYCHVSHLRCRIPKNDAYRLYLAYHEGQGGYNRKSYRKKAHVKQAARTVRALSKRYAAQLVTCEREFQETGGGCWFWPF